MSIRNLAAAAAIAAIAGAASAGQLYFNGFETDTSGWSNVTRVASGNAGITSATGSFHAVTGGTTPVFTNFGGYNFGPGSVPTAFQNFSTSVAIYLDVNAGYANDRRFDFSSAISRSDNGNFLQDFVFNAGFYDDATGPGANTNRFVISAGNNSGRPNSFPKNTGAIAIGTSGWYTFGHTFYENAGKLFVDMTITDSSNTLVNSWTLGNVHNIGNVGGNRYGWLVNNEMGTLAFDNSELTLDNVIPLPTTGAMATLGLLTLGARRRR